MFHKKLFFNGIMLNFYNYTFSLYFATQIKIKSTLRNENIFIVILVVAGKLIFSHFIVSFAMDCFSFILYK